MGDVVDLCERLELAEKLELAEEIELGELLELRPPPPLGPLEVGPEDDRALCAICRNILALTTAHALSRGYGEVYPNHAERDAARAWFYEGGPGFELVCRMAGFQPATVRANMLARLSPKREAA